LIVSPAKLKKIRQGSKKIVLPLCLLFFCVNAYPEIKVTEHEMTFDLVNNYDRVFRYSTLVSSDAMLVFNDVVNVKAGASYGGNRLYDKFNVSAETGLSLKFLKKIFLRNLCFDLFYTMESYPKFYTVSNSVITAIGLKAKFAGISLGWHGIWTSFYEESAIYEAGISFKIYIKLLQAKKLTMDIIFSNFDFYSHGGYGNYYLGINTVNKINGNFSVYGDLSIYQSGSVGFSSTFYGLSLRSGIKISW
jgi:hypothetical protein